MLATGCCSGNCESINQALHVRSTQCRCHLKLNMPRLSKALSIIDSVHVACLQYWVCPQHTNPAAMPYHTITSKHPVAQHSCWQLLGTSSNPPRPLASDCCVGNKGLQGGLMPSRALQLCHAMTPQHQKAQLLAAAGSGQQSTRATVPDLISNPDLIKSKILIAVLAEK